MRRVLELDESDLGKPLLMEYSHDDDCEMYINGVEILNSGNTTANNRKLQLPEEAMKVLKPGKILSLCIVTTGWLPVIWTSVCGRNKSTNRFLPGLQHKLLPM